MRSWLDRCESVCCLDSTLLSVDKIKLRNELQNVQVNRFPIVYLSFVYHKICSLSNTCYFPFQLFLCCIILIF